MLKTSKRLVQGEGFINNNNKSLEKARTPSRKTFHFCMPPNSLGVAPKFKTEFKYKRIYKQLHKQHSY